MEAKSSKLVIYYDKILGAGSFAKVYVGKYKNTLVAVKIVDTSNAKEKLIKQLKRELDIIRILRNNPHPNIPEFYKIIEDNRNKRYIIVMEWCKGGELNKLIKFGLDTSQIKMYFKQIVDGYMHLLNLNIIHRDMKSTNIMLTKDLSTIKIIDFGLAKVISTDMTRTVVGSPAYMAPERLGAQYYDSSSDIWSIGIILYEMMYKVNPFKDCKNKNMLVKYANEPLSFPEFRETNVVTYVETDIDAKTDADKDAVESNPNPNPNPNPDANIRIEKVAERVQPDFIEFMTGMLSIDPIDRYQWDEIRSYSIMLSRMDSDEVDRFNTATAIFMKVRSDALIKSKTSDFASTNTKSSDSADRTDQIDQADQGDSDQGPMFDMEMDKLDKLDRKYSKTDADTDTETDRLVPSPNFTSEYGSFDVIEEKTTDQMDCLEEYFLLNNPSIFALYGYNKDSTDTAASMLTHSFKKDSGTLDYSFLETMPFLQDSYKQERAYDSIRNGASKISSIVRSKSVPIVTNISTGVSNIAKKAASVLNDLNNRVSPH